MKAEARLKIPTLGRLNLVVRAFCGLPSPTARNQLMDRDLKSVGG